ncbi:MAG: LPS export ABC transporter periplasmic protein LptC [Alphaproteobacteria bacterium]|nr:LPS export ABC transporter periplasmic protein LptC [Alphaproteobacteria bacterium]MBQ4129906.1 LPS export ABC transporter periplasmic protein LptC [Alphaproteobacteria bacterium]
MKRYTADVHKDKRNFIIFTKHRRLKRLWQFFFTGWGLVMVAALVAGSLFTKQILWTPISAINMTDIVSNQFKMSGASFVGTDKNGEPFKIRANTGYQEYDNPDIIFLDTVSGTVSRTTNGTRTTDNITARRGRYNRQNKTITLTGDVRVDSSNGDKLRTNELVIRL